MEEQTISCASLQKCRDVFDISWQLC